jgi:hypothetical protein
MWNLRFFLSCLVYCSFVFANDCELIKNQFKADIEFKATSNMPGMDIDGSLSTPLLLKYEEGKELTVPFNHFKTGMDSRDEHMYKEIFASENPTFKILKLSCSELDLNLKLGKVSKTFKVKIASSVEKLFGEFSISLADFNIKAPEKFGVKVKDTVLVHLKISRP